MAMPSGMAIINGRIPFNDWVKFSKSSIIPIKPTPIIVNNAIERNGKSEESIQNSKKFIARKKDKTTPIPPISGTNGCLNLFKSLFIIPCFLSRGISVFCEKPLTTDRFTSSELYEIASNNKCVLMTDWVFTFNNNINYLKKRYEDGDLGEIKSVTMNRLNFGPERLDVNARFDLASHDVSIIQHIFNQKPEYTCWHDYRKNERSYQQDSVTGFIKYNKFQVIINASWCYSEKNRDCVFEFDRGVIKWDDSKCLLASDTIKLSPPQTNVQPLELAIKTFFSFDNKQMKEQAKLTNDIMEILKK